MALSTRPPFARSAVPALLAVGAALLFAAPSALAVTPTARSCGLSGVPVEANCLTVSMSMWIEYENCNVWGQNANGIWQGDCPTHWIIDVSATNWVTPGSFNFNWPGWCDGEAATIDVGSHGFSYECRANGPLYAMRCDWPYDPSFSITVHGHGLANPAGGELLGPGSMTVSASAPRPPPPGGC